MTIKRVQVSTSADLEVGKILIDYEHDSDVVALLSYHKPTNSLSIHFEDWLPIHLYTSILELINNDIWVIMSDS